MAMTLPIAIPSNPSAGNSTASDESSNHRTPLSPSDMQTLALPASPDQSNNNGNTQLSQQQNPGIAQMKRKPSRRANTAERRATHNAVERQRRETLNGRFLDLAGLLPNLSQIRRPSKSSIVNSSIAHIHASRRHRLLASRELRLVKMEADALRRELNEWRDRAGLPRVEEPVRGEGFSMVLSGEVEVLTAVIEDEEEGGDDYGDYDNGEDFTPSSVPTNTEHEEMRMTQQNAASQMIKNANANPFAHNLPANHHNNNGMHMNMVSRPMIATSPSSVSYENPAMGSLYEPHQQQAPFNGQYLRHNEEEKVNPWDAQLYSALATGGPHQQMQLQAQRTLFTPPTSAHGMSTAPPSSSGNGPVNAFNDSQAFFANFQRQQQQQMVAMHGGNMGHMYGSPDGDDSSSVGSVSGRRRERSGSMGSGSGFGSPQHGSPLGNYELSGAGDVQGDYGMQKQFRAGLQINTGVGGPWGSRGDSAVEMMKQTLSPPISIGGGGNNGFMMMMM